jgi:hypothetical protein
MAAKSKRARASLKALQRQPKNTVDRDDLSRQTKRAARERGPADLKRAARKAARTRKSSGS